MGSPLRTLWPGQGLLGLLAPLRVAHWIYGNASILPYSLQQVYHGPVTNPRIVGSMVCGCARTFSSGSCEHHRTDRWGAEWLRNTEEAKHKVSEPGTPKTTKRRLTYRARSLDAQDWDWSSDRFGIYGGSKFYLVDPALMAWDEHPLHMLLFWPRPGLEEIRKHLVAPWLHGGCSEPGFTVEG